MRPVRVPAGLRRLPAQYPPAGPQSSRAPGLDELRVQQAEGAGPVGGAQARGGRPAQREGAEVLRGEGDHVGRLAQQQEEQEIGDERFGLRVLLQVPSVAEAQLLLAGTEPEPDPGPPCPGKPPRRDFLQGGIRDIETSQPPGVCIATGHEE